MTLKDEKAQFDELSFDKQKELFFKSSYTERADLLLRSQDPVHLANSMSCEEMYLVTRDMDLDMRSEILKYANLPQLFFMSDLDCWRKDRISRKGFIEWLKCLEQADLERLSVWLERMDYEMIVAGLKQLIQVIKPEWEYAADELLGDKPYFTLDGLYYIQTQEDNFETVKLAIEVLYQNARAEYVNIMEGLLSEMEYEMEEQAYRLRQIRLSERGFPDIDSALRIYLRLSPEEFEKLPKKNLESKSLEKSKTGLPDYPVLFSKERLFLDDVLLNISKESESVIHSIQEELIWLSNKVMACEGINLASEAKVRHSIERVRRFVNIGLEVESGEAVERAKQLVQERWLEFLFRRGFTQLINLRTELEEIITQIWKSSERKFLDFMGENYEPVCKGLLDQHPAYFEMGPSSGQDVLRDFKSLEEVRLTERFLIVLKKLLNRIKENDPKIFQVLSVSAERDEEPATLVQLMGTKLAQYVLTGKPVYRILSKKDLAEFFHQGFEKNGGKHILKQKILSGFTSELLNGKKDEDLQLFFYQLIDKVEEDFHGISGRKSLDPRYINSVRIKA